jgi:hypothetical protein
MSNISQDLAYQVRIARWEGWRRLAKQLPNHHVLAVELLRIGPDDTVAIFTVVKHREPVQHVVHGDSRGQLKKFVDHGGQGGQGGQGGYGGKDDGAPPQQHTLSLTMELKSTDGGGLDANSIAMGDPPPKEPPPPGITALGGVMLGASFGVGDALPVA